MLTLFNTSNLLKKVIYPYLILINTGLFITFIVFVLLPSAYAKNTHYKSQESVIKNYFSQMDIEIEIEPHGSRDADILGTDKMGNKIVGEIKNSAEIENNSWWSSWNNKKQKFGGKEPSFKLEKIYSDKGTSVSPKGRGWIAVIDGQLRRAYSYKHKTVDNFLIIDNYKKYQTEVQEALRYLKKQGRIKHYVITHDKSGIAFIKINYDKLTFFKGVSINLKNSLKKISKYLRRIAKFSVALGVIVSGYSITKEIYDRKMGGETVHPSRILARALTGFLGCCAIASLLGAILILIPYAGPFLSILGSLIGGILGAIGSEWLFEKFMPIHGIGWSYMDIILGCILGSILGILVGISIGLISLFKIIKKSKISLSNGASRFIDDILSYFKTIFKNIGKPVEFAIKGFLLGGLTGALSFFIIFVYI